MANFRRLPVKVFIYGSLLNQAPRVPLNVAKGPVAERKSRITTTAQGPTLPEALEMEEEVVLNADLKTSSAHRSSIIK